MEMKKMYWIVFSLFLLFAGCEKDLVDGVDRDTLSIYLKDKNKNNLLDSDYYDTSRFNVYYKKNGEYQKYYKANLASPKGFSIQESLYGGDEGKVMCLGIYIYECYDYDKTKEVYNFPVDMLFDYGNGDVDTLKAIVVKERREFTPLRVDEFYVNGELIWKYTSEKDGYTATIIKDIS